MQKINPEESLVEIPKSMPLLPIRDLVVFPYMILPLFVGRESSIKAVEASLAENRLIFLSSQIEVNEENPTENSIYKVGTIAMIMRMRKFSDDRIKILVQGISKGMTLKYKKTSPYFQVEVQQIKEKTILDSDAVEIEALVRTVKDKLEKIIAVGRSISPDILLVLDDISDPGRLADLISSNLGLRVQDSQKILECHDPKERLALISEILSNEMEILQVQAKIRDTARDEMSKSQREYFLREQMRAIKNELGEVDSKNEELEETREKILKAKMPEKAQEEALKQLGRLERMHPDTSEASMIRNYLDWIVELPWSKSTEDNLDLKNAQKTLNEDHYDLKKVKERILEFLAVRKLKSNKHKSIKGPILCLTGPPGVGKTSLGRSVARAMGRKYHRISLGGMRDEAEIRGHRRTYVGAMPGKIIQALKQTKTHNPVIVLDEVDKLGSDFHGDPSAAMLEVLDPEQNSTFRDNYLSLNFDLSRCLFIATANTPENIPHALRDRMESIPISGYTENDKIAIAKKHLIQRQMENNGIKKEQIEFTDNGLHCIISQYTYEAGLRNLEREIGSICRKIARKVVSGYKGKTIINSKAVHALLGVPKFIKEDHIKENQVGVAVGLAWTQAGGEILHVEALKMKGKGGLMLTGQLGDVMKESAKAALSFARAHSQKLGVDEKWFQEYEIHIHIPAGAIAKDGPSAGITMATSLISLLTKNPVRKDVAMTGEVTLGGRVLPVGGIREKALAALNHDIRNIIVPFTNKKDISEIPEECQQKMNFILVKNLEDVLSVALEKKLPLIPKKQTSQLKPLKKRGKKPKSSFPKPTAAA